MMASAPPTTPPRASFMGLPVELRLQIYGYVFLPVRWKYARAIRYRLLQPGPLHTATLVTCKQVFSEAMPSCYNQIELNILTVGSNSYAYAEKLIRSIPTYALPHVNRARIHGYVQYMLDAPINFGGWELESCIEQYCATLSEKLPNVKELELEFYNTYSATSFEGFERFGALATLPELQRLVVSGYQSRETTHKVAAAIIGSRADEAGKSIEVLLEAY